MHPHLHGPRALALIAIFKFAKVAMLIVLAAILFHLSTPEAIGAFADWLRALPLATGHQYVGRAVSAVTDMNPHTVGLFAIVALVYAVLYSIEGYGLWENARWAKYLTVISTSLFVPLELWELWRHFSWPKVAALVINLLIVAYLVKLLRMEIAAEHRADAAASDRS